MNTTLIFNFKHIMPGKLHVAMLAFSLNAKI